MKHWGQRERTFRSILLRVLIPRTVAFAAVAAALLVGQAMTVAPSSSPIEVPTGTPVWTAADQVAHPGCVPSAHWPAGKPAAAVVVHRFSDDSTVQLAFDNAWALNHNGTETDDVWVLGVCP